MNAIRHFGTYIAALSFIMSCPETAPAQAGGSQASSDTKITTPANAALRTSSPQLRRTAPRPTGETPVPQRSADRKGLSLAQMMNADRRGENPMALNNSFVPQDETVEEGGGGEDDVARRQSVDAFNSLEDGQPGAPGELELELNFGYFTSSFEDDAATFEAELQYTLDGNEFLRNTQLLLSLPLELGNGGIDGNADITFGWQQRWVKEEGLVPTISTLAEIRTPSGDDSSGVDGSLTGIVAKDIGPGTLYVNGFIKTVNGDNIENRRDFQWGFRTGYKWRLSDNLSLIGDYLLQSSEEDGNADINLLELSGEYHVNDHLTIGPGIFIGLDDNSETPNFGAGVRVLYSF